MKGLLLRLTSLDADAASALRVISFFDQLIAARAPLRTVLRETAKLAECPAGVEDRARGVCLRADPADGAGRDHTGSVPATAVVQDITADSRVWLERPGPKLPLDDILLERFGIAVAPLLDHGPGPLPKLGDTALVELALSASAGEAERSRALNLMRFDPGKPLHVLAVSAPPDRLAAMVGALGGPAAGVRGASLGPVHAVLVRSLPDPFPGPDIAVGIGPALRANEAPESWRQARTALRFATLHTGRPAAVRADELGALAVIAQRLRAEDIARVADLGALDALAAEPNGVDTLAVLTAFCVTGSARKAAAEVYRHHSTVAARLASAEAELGFSIGSPGGRLRLELALLLRHLRDTAE